MGWWGMKGGRGVNEEAKKEYYSSVKRRHDSGTETLSVRRFLAPPPLPLFILKDSEY